MHSIGRVAKLSLPHEFLDYLTMIIAIAAVGKNGVIGVNNKLPWHIPEDMAFFKKVTKDTTVIMGRKTFETLGKPLPNRKNIVLTRDENWTYEGVTVIHSLVDSISFRGPDIFVIGGAEVYELMMPMVDEVWLTEIDQEFEGDTFFPHYSNGTFNHPDFMPYESMPQKAYDLHEYFFKRYKKNVV